MLEYILSAILITTHLIAVLIFLDKVRRTARDVSYHEAHQGVWWSAFFETCMNNTGRISGLKGYQLFRWRWYCYKTAFLIVLLKRKEITWN